MFSSTGNTTSNVSFEIDPRHIWSSRHRPEHPSAAKFRGKWPKLVREGGYSGQVLMVKGFTYCRSASPNEPFCVFCAKVQDEDAEFEGSL